MAFLLLIIMLALIAAIPVVLITMLGLKLRTKGPRVSQIMVLTLVAVVLVTCTRPRFVKALDDNVGFSISMDYQDRYLYGFPLGVWCRYTTPKEPCPDLTWWQWLADHIDSRGAFADILFWGYLGVLSCIPGGIHIWRNRKHR